MKDLYRGILKFQRHVLPYHVDTFEALKDKQKPPYLFITCSDSRVVPNLMMLADPGHLFIVRNVGNMIPVPDHQGHSTGDYSEASAIEFAVGVLGVKTIIVCGHSGCGAMKAAATAAGILPADPSAKPPPPMPNLGLWLHNVDDAVARLEREGAPGAPRDLSIYDKLGLVNVLTQAARVRQYPIVADRLAPESGPTDARPVVVHEWWFDIQVQRMLIHDRNERRFRNISDADAND